MLGRFPEFEETPKKVGGVLTQIASWDKNTRSTFSCAPLWRPTTLAPCRVKQSLLLGTSHTTKGFRPWVPTVAWGFVQDTGGQRRSSVDDFLGEFELEDN